MPSRSLSPVARHPFVAALPAVAFAVASAVTTPAVQEPAFRAGVRVVRLDVSVLDQAGQPVRDLTASDFSVTERGRPLRIHAFEAVDVAQPVLVATSPGPALEPGGEGAPRVPPEPSSALSVADVTPGRLMILIMDDDMTPANPRWARQARAIARAIVDRLDPEDRVAIQFTRAANTRLEMTTDRTWLLDAIDSFSPGGFLALPPSPTGDDEVPRYRRTMLALEYTVEALAPVTDRQKLIAYIGPGIPVNQTLTGTKDEPARPWNDDFVRYMNGLFSQAERANVAVYTYDPTGLDGLEDYAYDRIFLAERTKSTRYPGPPPLIDTLGGMQSRARSIGRWTVDFAVSVAENTGGRALVRSDNFEPAVDRMFADTSFYYLLAVEPLDPEPDGRFHEVNVSVQRPGVEVRARRGYYYER